MGFYSRYILPWLFEWSLKCKTIDEYREEVLSGVKGEILEIGFGTGHNLPFYPDKINRITAIDHNPGNTKLAKSKIRNSNVHVDHRIADCKHLPFESGQFDTVISTFTLCSVDDLDRGLSEIRRVLKPGGQFSFIEHGLSNEKRVQKWQHILTPLQKRIADGCHLNRNMEKIMDQHFKSIEIRQFYEKKLPKTAGYFYLGRAFND